MMKKIIHASINFIPLTILILYFITRLTLSHDNMIFLTVSFLLYLITTFIISFILITAYIESKENKNNNFNLSQISALFSNRYTLFERSGVFIADILAILQIIYLIKEKKGTKNNV